MTRLLGRLLGRLPVGWLQLTHSRGRLAAAIAGVAFANVLVLVQLGVSGALTGTIAQGYEVFRADLIVSAADANTLTDGGHVARQHLWQALADPEVSDGMALYIGNLVWSRPGGDATLQTFGIDPAQAGFLAPGAAAISAPLALADRAILDRMTRGLDPALFSALSLDAPLTFEAARRTLHVTGSFRGGVGFSADGYLIVSDQTFLTLFPRRHTGAPNHLLLRLAPGADPDAVAARLRDRLGADLRIRTLPEAIAADQRYQGTQRPTGIIFGFGVVIGVLVGIVIVYQVLSTDVADHLREYATFKAVGYPHRFFVGIILEEALILATLGFVPGIAIATGLYAALNAATGLPMVMTAQVAMMVLAGTIAACALSGIIATRRLAAADPADLF
ncbi:MAG: ABC transporter permease [Rhodobacteraceae bacterium]|nr:ABC transporter permease [Paracoccaceae bacterium]